MSMARATKAELELRVGEAASMLAQGNGATVVTAHVAEIYRISRRQARRITAAAYELLVLFTAHSTKQFHLELTGGGLDSQVNDLNAEHQHQQKVSQQRIIRTLFEPFLSDCHK